MNCFLNGELEGDQQEVFSLLTEIILQGDIHLFEETLSFRNE